VSFRTVDLYKQVAQEGRLGVRLYAMVREGNASLAASLAKYRTVGFANNHVTLRTIKVSIDGALGPRGAWLLEPYADLPTSTGLNTSRWRRPARRRGSRCSTTISWPSTPSATGRTASC